MSTTEHGRAIETWDDAMKWGRLHAQHHKHRAYVKGRYRANGRKAKYWYFWGCNHCPWVKDA